MCEGYIKLWRVVKDSSIILNPNALQVFIYILTCASHKTKSIPFNGKDIEVEKGCLITGRKSMAKTLCISEQNVRSAWTYLKVTNRITIKVTNRFSIIRVVNWEKYQNTNQPSNQVANHPLTNSQPSTNQQLTTKKKEKNEKNEKNKKKKEEGANKFTPPSHNQVSEYFNEWSFRENKNIDITTEPMKFVAHAESKGWLVGKTKMKSWKASARGWMIRSNEYANERRNKNEQSDELDEAAILRAVRNSGPQTRKPGY